MDAYNELYLETVTFFTDQHAETFPAQYRSKKPIPGKRWKELQFTFPQWEKLLNSERYNLAIRGGTRENVVVLDPDSPLHFQYLCELEPPLDRLFNETLVVRTPGRNPNGYHVIFRAPFPVESSKDTDYDIDIKADSGYAITVPSVHPNGRQYEFDNDNPIIAIDPETFEELTHILNIKPARVAPPSPSFSGYTLSPEFVFHTLSPFYRDILRGTIPKKYSHANGQRDSSRADQAVITVLVKNGFSVGDVMAVYQSYVHGKHKFRHRKHPERYIEHSYQKAVQYYRHNRKVIDYLVDRAWNAVTELFTGRTSHSNVMVVRSILWTMKRSDTVYVGLAVREIMLYTGMENKTVQRAIKRLQNNGYVVRMKGSYYNRAAIYGLTVEFFQAIHSEKEKFNVTTHLHSVNPDSSSEQNSDDSSESARDKFNVTTHLHSLRSERFIETSSQDDTLLRSLTSIPFDPDNVFIGGVENDPSIDPLCVYDLLAQGKDYRNRDALNRNSDALIDYINSHIGEEIPSPVLLEASGLANRQTLRKKLSRIGLVVPVVETKIPGKTKPTTAFTFPEEITESHLQEIAEKTGTSGKAEQRRERIKKERETYQQYLTDVVAPRLAEHHFTSNDETA